MINNDFRLYILYPNVAHYISQQDLQFGVDLKDQTTLLAISPQDRIELFNFCPERVEAPVVTYQLMPVMFNLSENDSFLIIDHTPSFTLKTFIPLDYETCSEYNLNILSSVAHHYSYMDALYGSTATIPFLHPTYPLIYK